MENNSQLQAGQINIQKASGDIQIFDSEKLFRSLLSAGALPDLAREIVTEISASLFNGITTKQIYRQAFALLRKNRSRAALRYRLKQAMLELGPTGYPFEELVGQLFENQGFSVEVGVTVQGKNVTHEMDVIATNHRAQHLMECKYHGSQGQQVSIQVPLYVRSRVNDIVDVRMPQLQYANFQFTGWVVTNTRFSADSIAYGTGAGLKMLAWDYPAGEGLKEMLERARIFPVTVLIHLTGKEKKSLVDQGVVTCNQLRADLSRLAPFELSSFKFKALLSELDGLYNAG